MGIKSCANNASSETSCACSLGFTNAHAPCWDVGLWLNDNRFSSLSRFNRPLVLEDPVIRLHLGESGYLGGVWFILICQLDSFAVSLGLQFTPLRVSGVKLYALAQTRDDSMLPIG